MEMPRYLPHLLTLTAESAACGGGGSGSRDRQGRWLRQLVRYAAQYSPFHAQRFRQAGIELAGIRTPADLARLPVLPPEVVRASADRIASTEVEPRRCTIRLTTGTTGSRLAIPTLPLESVLETQMLVRGYMRCGLRPWHRQAKVIVPRSTPAHPRLLQRLGLFRRSYLPIVSSPEEKVAWLRRHRPDALMGWASALNEIALRLEREDAVLPIPLVFSSSDMLWPDIRRRAEQRLRARVVDWYGAVETGPIAWSCPAGAMHLAGDAVIVELLDADNQPAPAGQVVCTPLWRYAFPLLRLALGDSAEWLPGPCPCGSPRPALCHLRGRELDLLRQPDGTGSRLPMPVLTVGFAVPGVRQFQFVQAAPDRALLRVVTGPEFTAEVERRALEDLQRELGPRVRVRLLKTAAIRLPPGVKFTPVVTLERLERIRAEGGDPRVFLE
jgi:phenylacetate-CoA ligase